jgi:hypothetical protein
MLTRALLASALLLSGCAQSQPWLKRDLADSDLRKHKLEIVGQTVTVYAGVKTRYGGRPEVMLWMSAAARAHAFGPERADYCIWADDKSGKLASLEPWTIVRVRGVVRTDPNIQPQALECPSDLILSDVEVLSVDKAG